MLDLLDLFLLRRGVPADDQSIAFRRIDGDPASKVVYFLPWNTPFGFARRTGMAPLDFLAAYEMPPAIVSSDPQRSVEAMLALVEDARSLLSASGANPAEVLIVGLSAGTYAATCLAGQLGARLCFVAGADRADFMLWQSPAARIVRRRAEAKGRRWSDYARAMLGLHPVDHLARIGKRSLFVLGTRDPFVPQRRAAGLLAALAKAAPHAEIVKLDGGHLKTLLASGRHQMRLAGIEPRSAWQACLPSGVAARWLWTAGGEPLAPT